MTWENHGVAPAYHRYGLFIKLVNKSSGQTFIQQLTGSDNRAWFPDEIVAENSNINLDKSLAAGRYDLLINMRDDCGFHHRNISLALRKEREVTPGWYKLGEVMVK
jgi:hypothetical protein